MRSLPALVVLVLTASAITHSGNTLDNQLVNQLRVRLPIYRPAITNVVTPIQLNPMVRHPVYYGAPGFMFDRLRIPLLGLQAPELTLLTEAIDEIKKRSEIPSKLDKLVTEMPLSLPYAESPRHQLGTKETKLAPANKIKDKSRHRVLPPPLVRSLEPTRRNEEEEKERLRFAMTPSDVGYFETTAFSISDKIRRSTSTLPYAGAEIKRTEDVRDIRQNPILKNAKSLVAEDLDKLRQGLDSDKLGSTAKPKNDSDTYGSGGTGYWVIISAAVTSTIILSLALILYGFYVLVQRAKSAAAVDYPAYGVTGPTVDSDGDRRLAQSAQMYHYQHQKQQIIAMERNLVEQCNGSLSGPESEDENEEGDYTVYECPGCAATGDMEVKNPLFDQFTPATPGKVQVVQTQPKE